MWFSWLCIADARHCAPRLQVLSTLATKELGEYEHRRR